ncbi:cytochrome-c peroxidase [Archangium sp.]|uniref:cytochrome-c peroxidase n=1 Tax=Archangium sp. TaxID=1872627 RepID=UPI002D34639D|nr:cytochrome c peroxidase [Archangium sp.]HYO57404.1 cytochrome c peroxidase [Archangium sp.]
MGTAPRKLEVVIPRVQNPPPASDLNNLAGDLRAVPVPKPPNLGDFVKDEQAAIALGKALFWDMQVGSDGQTACASCHFRAGADPRSKNQLSPGLNHVSGPDLTFKTGGLNHQLQASDFPLTRLLTPGVRGGLDPEADSNDVVSSQGVHWLAPGLDPLGFSLGFVKARRVAPRNTPSVINAVFNHRQFWDGRAENVFNGVNHLGTRDPGAKVFRADDPLLPIEVRVELINSSLASQAVGPILSNLEMAEPGRTALDVARELAKTTRKVARRVEKVRPLALQKVEPTDSVLGALSRWPQAGLAVPAYDQMIKAAFHDVWWNSKRLIQVAPDGTKVVIDHPDDDPATEEYSLLQHNFSLFFGLAIQMYESTLVSDDTPWDRFRRENPEATDPDLNPWTNPNPSHINRLALFGAHLFNERAHGPANVRCANCHELAEMTDASVRRINALGPVRIREGNVMDRGFHNIGVRPTEEDLGAGARDAFGPLSYTQRRFPMAPPATFDGVTVTKGFGVEGAFKMPSLRNVALTAPYFHNGDVRTLREVVELYSRGGNVAPIKQTDGTPIEPMSVPGLTADETDAMVAWLEALTDERVLYRRAPFDHPQLFVPNGHAGDDTSLADANGDGFADDVMLEIPAVGAAGGAPIPGFLEGPFGPPGSP